MNNPNFYIFGVPDGFNMLSGTPDEILYYQLFYDTSKKGREMRINRKANGETVYSYLIYNLVSCKGREGAFLGMSIAFTGHEFCNNPVALKELFEGIYKEVILKADVTNKIITAIDGDNAVGKFCITKFDERREMCEKIGRIIVNNVLEELASSIRPIDSSFDNSKEGRILTLPLDADNNRIGLALHSYTWVSLSSEYKVAPNPTQATDSPMYPNRKPTSVDVSQDLLSIHFINELSKKVGSYKDFIIQGLKGMVSFPEITAKREEINHNLDTIEEYVGRQPELAKVQEDYMSIYKELVDLKPQHNDLISPGTGHIPPKVDEDGGIMHLIRPHISIIITSLCAVLVIVVVFILWPSGNSKTSPTDSKDLKEVAEKRNGGTGDASVAFDKNKFQNLLASANYKAAWSMLQKVTDTEKRKSLEVALQNSYREWFILELNKRQNNLQALYELKKKIAAYADFNKDDARHNELLNYYIIPLQKIAAQQERKRQERAQRELEEKLTRESEQRKISNGKDNTDTPANPRSRGGVIKIFKANSNYAKGSAVSASAKNVISCKKNDCFVVEGASLTSKDNDIEAVPNGNIIQIRVSKVGSHKIKLNQVEYTFNVAPK